MSRAVTSLWKSTKALPGRLAAPPTASASAPPEAVAAPSTRGGCGGAAPTASAPAAKPSASASASPNAPRQAPAERRPSTRLAGRKHCAVSSNAMLPARLRVQRDVRPSSRRSSRRRSQAIGFAGARRAVGPALGDQRVGDAPRPVGADDRRIGLDPAARRGAPLAAARRRRSA